MRGNEIGLLEWEDADPLGGVLYALELYDPREDERLGWSFLVVRDGYLDIEELFVKPQYRRKGFACQLTNRIEALRQKLNLPLRAWVPFVDAAPDNRKALQATLLNLGLGVERSGVRWAAYTAKAMVNSSTYPTIRVPRPPADPMPHGLDKRKTSLKGTVLKYEDPFAPVIDPAEWEAAIDPG